MAKVAINNIGLAVVLAFYIVISVTQAHPPCGRLDNLAPSSGRPKDDRIHFRDQQGIRTTVINGTVIACYPDGTMVPMLPPSSNENSSEELTAYPTSSPNKRSSTSAHPVTLPRGCTDALCTNPLDYPVENIEMLLRSSGHKFVKSFGVDEIVSENVISTRIGDEVSEIQLCDSAEEVIFPRSGERKDESWLFIINNDQQQGVRVSKCRNPNQPCKMTDSFPFQYRTECKQQYVYRELVAYDNGVIKTDKFRVPACCSCVLHQKTHN